MDLNAAVQKALQGLSPEEQKQRLEAATERLQNRPPAEPWKPSTPPRERIEELTIWYAENCAFDWTIRESRWPTGESVEDEQGEWQPEIATEVFLEDPSVLQSLRTALADWLRSDRRRRLSSWMFDRGLVDSGEILEAEIGIAMAYGQMQAHLEFGKFEAVYCGGARDAYGQSLSGKAFLITNATDGQRNGGTHVWPGKSMHNRPQGVSPEDWPCAPLDWGCINSWVIRRAK